MIENKIILLWMVADLFNAFVLLPIYWRRQDAPTLGSGWNNPILGPVATCILTYYVVFISIIPIIRRIYHGR